MRRKRIRAGSGIVAAGLALAVLAPAAPVSAAVNVLPGKPIDIAVDDAHTANLQPQAAFDAAGNHVVTWTRWRDDGTQAGIVARLFDAQGNPRSDVFQVNTYQPSYQQNPVVAMNAAGELAIAWVSYGQDGLGTGIFLQHFRADGSHLGGETEVSTPNPGGNTGQVLGIDGAGRVVVAWWNTSGVYLRRFARNGRPLMPGTLVESADSPALAVLADGSFIMAWRTSRAGAGIGVWVQRFDAAAAPVGQAVEVQTSPIPDRGFPVLAVAPGGGFLVAWDSCDFAHIVFGCQVRARRFSLNFKPRTAEMQLSPNDFRAHWMPAVAVDRRGNFAVVWDNCRLDSGLQSFDCRVAARFLDPQADPGQVTWGVTSDDDLLDVTVAAGGGAFLVGFDTTNCDAAGCNGKTPTGVYAIPFKVQPQQP